MRAVALALGFFTTLGAVAGFVGCGSNVETAGTAATTGAGGHGGSVMSSTAITNATVGTGGAGGTVAVSSNDASSSVSTSSSSGGPDPTCEAACMHAASCGSNVCTQYGITCDQVNTQLDCIAACIANIPCPISGGQVLACVEMCKGGPSSSSSGTSSVAVGSSSSGTPTPTCQSCSVQSCDSSIEACAMDPAHTCLSWLECVQPCNQATPLDPACFEACDTQNASASALYDAVYSCACTSCTAECGSIPECGDVVDAGDDFDGGNVFDGG